MTQKAPSLKFICSAQTLVLNDQAQRVALDRVRRFVAQELELVKPDGSVSPVALGRIGVQIDKPRLSSLVRQARDPTSPLRQAWLARGEGKSIELGLPVVFDDEALFIFHPHQRFSHLSPSDARMDLDARKVLPEVDGTLLDVDASRLAVEDSLERGVRRVPLVFRRVEPRRRMADLNDVKLDAVLGEFETHYDRSEKARDRTFNLRLAASKLDGHVLLPGEIFDFNETVGPRDEING